MVLLGTFLALAVAGVNPLQAQVRIKDLTYLQGIESQQLIGYGLVIGLNGTGDSKRTEFTTQSVVNMLQRFGVNVPRDRMKIRNVAAVMVTAELPPYSRIGDRLPVTVSSLGDAKSLEGGVLLLTPLANAEGKVVATAQGPLSVGGFSVETTGGGGVRQNYTLVGRIPQGAIIQAENNSPFQLSDTLRFSLKEKDVTTAIRIVQAINQRFGDSLAFVTQLHSVAVRIPPQFQDPAARYAFLSEIEQIEVKPDVRARVVINERTGTVVVGGNVKVLPAAISHGNLSVEIQSEPIVSQPAPFSQGKTVVVPNTNATVYQDEGKVVTIGSATTVQEVAQALNLLGLTPRDIVAVLQALKEAGSLQADLIVM
ncbi:MAG: flagellar basal body P-ring protein FlgI [Calditrichaeota bacterium]|nr:MAG: flagellar basal body P-ring protein FlgI [Calditrichota bacterium]